MLKKYAVLAGIIVSVSLLLVAIAVYPGGSLANPNAVGFQWSQNFISNLFAAKAINGAVNTARVWADAGMILLSASFAVFFVHFSQKIPNKGAAMVIKYLGAGNMLFNCLIATPLHDLMVVIASTLLLVSLFYITVFVMLTRLHWLKCACVVCMLLYYITMFLYGSTFRGPLPVMQKITFLSSILLVLALEYGTTAADFAHIKSKRQKQASSEKTAA
ncbi:hypothetical protein HNQ91_002532 [Filimonas zeae]|uniref:DUF998 domain-containing protein n=1 Tax=Filimonas zeae TaxID=1737353 RepID=A0A917IUK4_9BACT|nr:hypothetical protein [Filimonas zeae]MDR6339481.1 hypothetical protein [Filimonas zeae]GGH63419.1 hypothetical protein GCM10011379_14290 [Filimonas zeae]